MPCSSNWSSECNEKPSWIFILSEECQNHDSGRFTALRMILVRLSTSCDEIGMENSCMYPHPRTSRWPWYRYKKFLERTKIMSCRAFERGPEVIEAHYPRSFYPYLICPCASDPFRSTRRTLIIVFSFQHSFIDNARGMVLTLSGIATNMIKQQFGDH